MENISNMDRIAIVSIDDSINTGILSEKDKKNILSALEKMLINLDKSIENGSDKI
jgi:uncharacterized protein YlaN (UPF0358 family)